MKTTNLVEAVRTLTDAQREAYLQIKKSKFIKVEDGKRLKTYETLLVKGLIKRNPDSACKNEFVIIGPGIELPPKRERERIRNVFSEKKQPVKRWPADHDNPSREDHVRRILSL